MITFGGQYLRINNIIACTSLSGQNVGTQTDEKLTQKYVWHSLTHLITNCPRTGIRTFTLNLTLAVTPTLTQTLLLSMNMPRPWPKVVRFTIIFLLQTMFPRVLSQAFRKRASTNNKEGAREEKTTCRHSGHGRNHL